MLILWIPIPTITYYCSFIITLLFIVLSRILPLSSLFLFFSFISSSPFSLLSTLTLLLLSHHLKVTLYPHFLLSSLLHSFPVIFLYPSFPITLILFSFSFPPFSFSFPLFSFSFPLFSFLFCLPYFISFSLSSLFLPSLLYIFLPFFSLFLPFSLFPALAEH